ncbi:polymorphic toxin type 44 domain-containing protein [Clostridium folliculivorans]|uniref:Bacterial toxin 44 domain-containing protein n=1 Tax=Clostridium folliculivorans TaxID=2886038 RepID=A0A9W5XYE7_9CLOT|nr:polymorphic toxin type 44 domain-containing protein [Clostridium folliculivorans]GKU23225.1 hypothetical protein CFOLD11_00510 [Clostridium folliculivorans]GKU29342.1 hypothetical protein CFB3_14480 [Clostridium folliculivorans]
MGFTYANNAKVINDFLYVRDSNGNIISGRQVDIGDNITVLDVSYSKQLVLVEYPTANGVVTGYVRNATNCIQYYYQNQYSNGATSETVYDGNGNVIGSLNPWEKATPIYKKDGKIHVVYNTDKGNNTKSGYVVYNGGFTRFDIRDVTQALKDLMVRYEYMYRSSWANNSPIEQLWQFYTLVRNKGALDLKNNGWNESQYIFDGVIVRGDAPGNILYGYLGKAFGYSDELLKRAAGYAQAKAGTNIEHPEWGTWMGDAPYGDDPIDQFYIQVGISYYYKMH